MNSELTQDVVAQVLANVAPDIDPSDVDPSARFREDLDLDSLDFLNLMSAVNEQLGVDVPEADYPKVTSLETLTAYLRDHAGVR